MKLIGMTLCYNESKMIPYIMPYYEHMHFDKLIIYDNESTDNSVELLKKYPFVEIRTFHTELKNNETQSQLKSNFFKEFCKNDDTWLYISDFDEVLYYSGNFKEYLELKDKEGYNYLDQDMLELISDNMPNIDNTLIHEKCEKGVWWGKMGHKLTLFKVSGTTYMKYTPGAHSCTWKTSLQKKSLNNLDIKSLHIKYIGYDFNKNKMKQAAARRSKSDILHKYGIQYNELKNDDKFDIMWNDKKAKSINVKDYIKE